MKHEKSNLLAWQKALAVSMFAAGIGGIFLIKASFDTSETPSQKSRQVEFRKSENAYKLYSGAASPSRLSSLDLFRKANKNVSFDSSAKAKKTSAAYGAPGKYRGARTSGFSGYDAPDIDMTSPKDKSGEEAGPGAPPAVPMADFGGKDINAGVRSGIGGGAHSGKTLLAAGDGKLQNKAAFFGKGNFAAPKLSGSRSANRGFSAGGSSGFGANTAAGRKTFSYGSGGASGYGGGLSDSNYGGTSGGNSSQGASAGESGNYGLAPDPNEPPKPVMVIWPPKLSFGNVEVYGSAVKKAFIMNTGNANLKIGRIKNLDPQHSAFSLSGNTCSNRVLKPGKSCELEVLFRPRKIRKNPHVTAFEIDSNDQGMGSFQNYLYAEGKPLPYRYNSYSNWWWYWWQGKYRKGTVKTVDFGRIPVGRSIYEYVKVVNNGGAFWENMSISKKHLPPGVSVVSDGCSGRNLAVGRICFIKLRFAPAKYGVLARVPHYGQFVSLNIQKGNKTFYSARPVFPEVIVRPATGNLKGYLPIYYKPEDSPRKIKLYDVRIKAKTCAPYPVPGLRRAGRYLFFLK